MAAILREKRMFILGVVHTFLGATQSQSISLGEARSVLLKSNEESNANRIQTLLQFYVSIN